MNKIKHNIKITAILLGMFIITQFIGLYVVNFYSHNQEALPYGMEPPQIEEQADYNEIFVGILIAFVIAIIIMLLLSKFNAAFILRLWFFLVVILALGITFNAIFLEFSIPYALLIASLLAAVLAVFKIYQRNLMVHNLTELFIYPGIAAVFVPILNIWTIIIFLIIISIYDMWAVWHSGIMQKMAKYQIDHLKIFGGFFVPHLTKNQKQIIKKMKKSGKTKELEKKKFRIGLAILGGGDVIFPIITAGVVLKAWGLIPALLVILGATLGLLYLFIRSEKKKFYPAMPFITTGIFAGMLIGWALQL